MIFHVLGKEMQGHSKWNTDTNQLAGGRVGHTFANLAAVSKVLTLWHGSWAKS